MGRTRLRKLLHVRMAWDMGLVPLLLCLGMMISSSADAGASVSNSGTSYSQNYYQPQQDYYTQALNTSGAAVFEARDGGGTSVDVGGYGSPPVDTGSYGWGVPPTPTMPPTIFKYQIIPSPPMKGGWGKEPPMKPMGWGMEPVMKAMGWGMEPMMKAMGWGMEPPMKPMGWGMEPPMMPMGWGWGDEGGDDDEKGEFPKELIGLLGLKGLKGLKGPLLILKGALFLKKLLGIPLFPFLLPLLLPLLLIKLAALLIPLALLLLIPVPVFAFGRNLLESPGGRNFKKLLQERLDSGMANLPQDIIQIVEKIKEKSSELDFSQLLSSNSTKDSASSWKGDHGTKNIYGEAGSRKAKVVYAASANGANIIKPSSVKSNKVL